MAGHNKWTQIKRQKGVADAKKSRLFSILAKQIQLEAKKANGDRQAVGLKTVMTRAHLANMPNDNIKRAIQLATGIDKGKFEELYYEAYGLGGRALIIEVITDNKNRTAQEIKHLLGEHRAVLAAPGSAIWAFEKVTTGWRPKTPHEPLDEDLSTLVKALEERADVKTVSL